MDRMCVCVCMFMSVWYANMYVHVTVYVWARVWMLEIRELSFHMDSDLLPAGASRLRADLLP